MRKPILCLDFDGVCHSYISGWKGASVIPDDPVPGFFEFLEDACKYFDVQIFSTRSNQPGGIVAMINWFVARRNEWCEENGKDMNAMTVSFPKQKPSAMITIDDRGWRFDGVWPEMKELKSFKPWNRR